ncbi:MAG: hypothetical protein FJ347_07535 [Sphingomonadales bacterium]|nr:hypothetical protein [Sphingomonadales bacterium]
MRFIKLIILISVGGLLTNCNRECRNLANTQSGGIVKSYDFGDCFLYSSLDSHVIIDDAGKWTAFKQKYLKYCDTQKLENIDFSQHMLVGNKLRVFACNVAFHRKLIINDSNKTYTYDIEMELCKGCNSELSSPNWVIMPKLPAGYTMVFRNKVR